MESKQTKTQNTLLIFIVAIVFSIIFKTTLALTLWITVCVIFAALQWIIYNPTQLTCTIVIGDFPPCEGIQKLTGFSRGLKFHKVKYFPYWHISNSIVLGYNRSENEDTVRLWAYGYVDGKHFQELIGDFKVGEKLVPHLYWLKTITAIEIYNEVGRFTSHEVIKRRNNKTLPIGFQLFPYAEIDGPNNERVKLNVEITDLKIS